MTCRSIEMPTLREFVVDVLNENNITSDPDEIIKQITEIARQRATNNVAAISDDEIRELVINNADLANRLAQEKKAKEEAREKELELKREQLAKEKAEEEERKKQEKIEKALEEERKTSNGEQMSLFG